MLQIKNISKQYRTGELVQRALDDVSVNFRDNEFVAILGPSGSGKTTLLNIIGGLDRYDEGDLVINGISTKKYNDRNWDSYRNHTIGFVFQSYNLITHQSILSNVELALTISGVSKKERRERAKEALKKVGLGEQIHKKPNQMSGGQMQRVAIARALVNNPDILLADEPTGALDSETSVQVMELLKEVAQDKLVIMVTHNAELAQEYATRTVYLKDGKITGDTDEFVIDENDIEKPQDKKMKRVSMSFFTALALSLNNLATKKARTFLTSFAGSIGIIGIALILAMSTGAQSYINSIQRETLASYPITITSEQSNIMGILLAASEMRGVGAGEENIDGENVKAENTVYSNDRMYKLFNTMFANEEDKNNLTAFKEYVDKQLSADTQLNSLVSTIQYTYDLPMNVYVKDKDGNYRPCDISDVFSFGSTENGEQSGMSIMMNSSFSNMNLWEELLSDKSGNSISPLVKEQYDLVAGKWPEKAEEIVLVLDRNGETTDVAFYALGLMEKNEVQDVFKAVMNKEEITSEQKSISYDELLNKSFKLILNSDYYSDNDSDGIYDYIGDDEKLMDMVIKNGFDLNIVGIIKPNPDANGTPIMGTFGYTKALTQYVAEKTSESKVLNEQKKQENENYDVLSGLPFIITEDIDISDSEKAEKIKEYFASLDNEKKQEMYINITSIPDDDELKERVDELMKDYPDRQSMMDLAVDSYNMDRETVESYLESYSDEELENLVREQFEGVIKAQMRANSEAEVEKIKTTPTKQELKDIKKRIKSNLKTKDVQLGYIAQAWLKNTAMDEQTIFTYLMMMDEESFNKALNDQLDKDALEMYSQYAALDAEGGVQKVADAFDELIEKTEDKKVLAKYYDLYMPSKVSTSTLEDNLKKLGDIDIKTPVSISIYAATFEDKQAISDEIEKYNEQASEDDKIEYTDYVAVMLSGVTTMIDAVSYVLIAFVAISLVVSSLMIGIITYISVLERTKEIGILRSIGASKRDVSRVFTAETLIVGLFSGLIGIGASLALCIPINSIIHALAGIDTINAFIPTNACITLVVISMVLTLIAGRIPSRMAAKKDPVKALRTE